MSLRNSYIVIYFAIVFLSGCEKSNDATTVQTRVAMSECPVLESKNWRAWINTMPGAEGGKLHVSGDVVLPTPGYDVSLTLGILDRRSPPSQRMTLAATPTSEMVAQVLTSTQLNESFPLMARSYHSIMIYCEDELLVEISEIETAQ